MIHRVEDVTELVRVQRAEESERAKLAEANSRFQAMYDQGLFAAQLDLEGRVIDLPLDLDEFTKGFFSAGGKLVVSEAQRVYARDIAAFASPKGTLDCIGAFSHTDFRADLAKIKLPHINHPRRCGRHRALRGQRRAHAQGPRGQPPNTG